MASSAELERLDKQLFVRNLAFETTEEDLVKCFEEIGPLKNVSIAYDANKKSRGFGFVKFALEEDARKALEKLQGTILHSRAIKLETGIKKDRKAQTSKSGELPATSLPAKQAASSSAAPAPSSSVPPSPGVNQLQEDEEDAMSVSEQEHDDNDASESRVSRSRQILVFGVPVDVSKKVFKMVISKTSRKLDVELIKEDHPLSSAIQVMCPVGKVMLVTAPSRQLAAKVLGVLATTNINNLGFAKFVKEAPEEVGEELQSFTTLHMAKSKLVARTLADLLEDQALRKRNCRVILRNLSFQATEQNVVDKLSRFGPIVEIDLPQVLVQKSKARHGKPTEVSRPKGFAFVTFLCPADAQRAVAEGAQLKVCNRPVAIDFSLSKTSFLKYGAENQPSMEQGDGEEEDDHASENQTADAHEETDPSREEEDEEDDEDDEDEDEENGDEDIDEDGEENEEAEEGAAANHSRKYGDDVGEGKTVFLRGLPFDATPQDVKLALRKFGLVELAVLVKDKNTGMFKGTAFAKFKEAAHASNCVAACAQGISVKERTCKVDLAVDKASAERLGSKEIRAKDKRNLYLANEGLVVANDSAAPLSVHDREKRQRAQSDKKKKLLNPLFFVSATRLSLRNLARTVTDADLRSMCNAAAKAGLERGLVTSQDMRNALSAQGKGSVEAGQSDMAAVPKPSKVSVKSAKTMLDMNKMRDGKPQSRGFAFVEFIDHAHALACLRELNNNPSYADRAIDADGKSLESVPSRLIVEFSLENMRKVKLQQDRRARAVQKASEEKSGDDKKAPTEKASEGGARGADSGRKGSRPFARSNKRKEPEGASEERSPGKRQRKRN